MFFIFLSLCPDKFCSQQPYTVLIVLIGQDRSRLMGTKDNIEPLLPCFAAIDRSDGSLADASVHWLPGDAYLTLLSILGAVGAVKGDFAIVKFAFHDQQLAAISYPALVP